MATSGADGSVRIWDIAAEGGAKPKQIGSRNMKQGDLYSMEFCQDIPWVLATGGSMGEIAVWDVSENIDIENHFKPFLAKGSYSEKDYNPDAVLEEEEANDEYESLSEGEKKPKKKTKKAKK